MVTQVVIEMKEIDEKVNNGSQFVAALNTFNKSNTERVAQAMDAELARVKAEEMWQRPSQGAAGRSVGPEEGDRRAEGYFRGQDAEGIGGEQEGGGAK